MGIAYFHGAPGGSRELELADRGNQAIIVPDRFALRGVDSAELAAALVVQIERVLAREPIRLIGFSIGCRWALAVAERLGDRVEQIDLIAPLGPFSLGHYDKGLKGYPLFEMARTRPRFLRLVLRFQALLARIAPDILLQLVLADSRGTDAELARDPAFRGLVFELFCQSLGERRDGYWRELVFATEDWSGLLARTRQPIRLWHGTEDNWAAPAMSVSLEKHLPQATVTSLPGLSHYSALKRVLPVLLREANVAPIA